jgi:K+-transporting ATPase ATPase C chain
VPYNAYNSGGYNSGGSNFGPTNKALVERVKTDVGKLKQENAAKSRPIW